MSVTQRDGVAMSARGDVASERGKGADDASWTNANITGPKNKKNLRGQFS
jgi:hypothetical protein